MQCEQVVNVHSKRELPDLCGKGLEIWDGCRRFRPAKHVRGPCQQLWIPFGELGGAGAKSLGQFRSRLVAFDCRQDHLGLIRRSVIPSCSRQRLIFITSRLWFATSW